MNKFYTTRSPLQAKHILLETEEQAIEQAKERTREDGEVRFVVRVLHRVEPDKPPVRVTRVT